MDLPAHLRRPERSEQHDRFVERLRKELGDPAEVQYRSRDLVARLALAMQASLLIRNGNPAVADAFCSGRVQSRDSLSSGALPKGIDCRAIIARVPPQAP